ncbi:hypothetical protein LXL04_034026 [Taraxacum kok-saghyz]
MMQIADGGPSQQQPVGGDEAAGKHQGLLWNRKKEDSGWEGVLVDGNNPHYYRRCRKNEGKERTSHRPPEKVQVAGKKENHVQPAAGSERGCTAVASPE